MVSSAARRSAPRAQLDASTGGSGSVDSAFLGTRVGHDIVLTLAAGQTFSLTVAGNTKDQTFTDLDVLGPGGGLTLLLPKKVSTNGLVVSFPKVLVNTTANYTVEVTNIGATAGRYKLTLKVSPP